MRQRVMIAMGLICEPRLLIADEPTTALDVTIQAQILELMKTIREKTGMAIIFITHNLAAIAEICDSVSVMYGGYMVEQGSVDDIFYQPLHPYTRGLLRSMPRIDEEQADRLVPIEGSPVNMVGSIPGCPFAPRCEQCMKVCVRAMPPRTVAEAGTPTGDGLREGSGYQGPSDEALSHEVSCWLTHKGAPHA
jgi:oligopeptide transport system ATP-binding protein